MSHRFAHYSFKDFARSVKMGWLKLASSVLYFRVSSGFVRSWTTETDLSPLLVLWLCSLLLCSSFSFSLPEREPETESQDSFLMRILLLNLGRLLSLILFYYRSHCLLLRFVPLSLFFLSHSVTSITTELMNLTPISLFPSVKKARMDANLLFFDSIYYYNQFLCVSYSVTKDWRFIRAYSFLDFFLSLLDLVSQDCAD